MKNGGAAMANENLSEKVSVNMNISTLSNIDILVDNGYYSNRSDFINQAVRDGLQKHQATLDRIIDRHMDTKKESPHSWFLGVCSLGNDELEEAKLRGQMLTYTGYGVLVVDKDIDTDLLFDTVKSIKVKGRVIGPQTVKEHYGLK